MFRPTREVQKSMTIIKKKNERMKEQSAIGQLQGGECPDGKDAVAVNAEGSGTQQVEREDRVRLCVDILGQQHRKLKVYAAQQGITLNELVERLADRLCDS